jgi:hypothetical protein
MTTKREDESTTAVGIGDGSLGGPGVGGSVNAPDAGAIRDPVGSTIAAPITTEPDTAAVREDPTVDRTALPADSPERERREDEGTTR